MGNLKRFAGLWPVALEAFGVLLWTSACRSPAAPSNGPPPAQMEAAAPSPDSDSRAAADNVDSGAAEGADFSGAMDPQTGEELRGEVRIPARGPVDVSTYAYATLIRGKGPALSECHRQARAKGWKSGGRVVFLIGARKGKIELLKVSARDPGVPDSLIACTSAVIRSLVFAADVHAVWRLPLNFVGDGQE
jgi:hypothetical protein